MCTNLTNCIRTKDKEWHLEECGGCICVSFLLGFEHLPLPQILRNEDSHLPTTFALLLPLQQSEDDDKRGKHQQEETSFTVTAISALVISIRFLLGKPLETCQFLAKHDLKRHDTPNPNLFSHMLITYTDCLPDMSLHAM